jgi:DNA topoisomerase-1
VSPAATAKLQAIGRDKAGQRQVRELRDAATARLVREVLKVPGRDVFKFVEGGEVTDVRRRHINAYLREAAGAPFTAKDFRTWAGTLLCAGELARRELELVPGRTSRKRLAQAAVKEVAARLGNTPAVARGSYISPAVLEGFAAGRCVSAGLGPEEVLGLGTRGGLHEAEKALVTFLRATVRTPAARARRRALRGGGRADASREREAGGAVGKPLRRAARRLATLG